MNNKIENQPFVSIITPVYNGEKYLAESIESILDQTYENWEYIICNNRSTDDTLQIAEKYAKKDARIKVYTNEEFLKQIPNWNAALRKISSDSKYCKEIHADDCLLPEGIEKLVSKAEKHPSAGIVSSYRFVGSEVGELFSKGLDYTTTFLPGKEVARQFLLNGLYLFGTPSTILYRSDLIRAQESFYNPKIVHADTDKCLDILKESDLAFVPQILSFTRLHDEATTNFADYYNTYSLFYIYALVEYGDYFLTSEEFEKQLSAKLRMEHRWLLKSKFNGSSKDVWPYHKKELEQLGLRIENQKLLNAFFIELSRMFRTDKIQAIKNRVFKVFKNTSSKEEATQKEVIEEKKRDTTLSKK